MGHKPWDRPWKRREKAKEKRRWRGEADIKGIYLLPDVDVPPDVLPPSAAITAPNKPADVVAVADLTSVIVDALKAAIDFDQDNPITADPEAFIAEQVDQIIGAAGSSSSYVPTSGKGRAEPEITRQQIMRAIDAEADGEDVVEVTLAADAVWAIFAG